MTKALTFFIAVTGLLQPCGSQPAETGHTEAAVSTPTVAPAADTAGTPVLVELFTSQGCSSCPPADRLLSELSARPGVCALSFHVNYWDRLGWKDPYAQQAFTDRQEIYGLSFRMSSLYTPQMVVQGNSECTGSDRSRAEAAIRRAAAISPQAHIGLVVQEEENTLSVHFELDGNYRGQVLYFALSERGIETAVTLGENSGKTLRHEHVVRQLESLQISHQRAGQIALTLPAGILREQCHVTAWLQRPDQGEVLAVARI